MARGSRSGKTAFGYSLTILAGVCPPSSPLYPSWRKVCDWACAQELFVSLKAEHREDFDGTKIRMVARLIP